MNGSIKVLFLTAVDVRDEIVKLFPDLVAEYILQKPIEVKALVETIRKRIASPPPQSN